MHQAVKKSIAMSDTKPVDVLLSIGFPMYEANEKGKSVLSELMNSNIKYGI